MLDGLDLDSSLHYWGEYATYEYETTQGVLIQMSLLC